MKKNKCPGSSFPGESGKLGTYKYLLSPGEVALKNANEGRLFQGIMRDNQLAGKPRRSKR